MCDLKLQVLSILAGVGQLRGMPQQENFGEQSGGRTWGDCWVEGMEWAEREEELDV
jgi:hypothetical protein